MGYILGHSDYITGLVEEVEVMAVTPQTLKFHRNRGTAVVVVAFGSLWCHVQCGDI